METKRKKKRSSFQIIFALALILALAFVLFRLIKPDLSNMSVGEELSEKQVEVILERLSDVMVLPEGEEPFVATVVNAAELQAQQPFYRNVEDGHVLIIYPSNQKAILFDAQDQKIINVGPLQVGDNQETQAVPVRSTPVSRPNTQENTEIPARNTFENNTQGFEEMLEDDQDLSEDSEN